MLRAEIHLLSTSFTFCKISEMCYILYLMGIFLCLYLCVCFHVQVVAVTVQGLPEGVQPPLVTALSSSSLHVSWSEPTSPNGLIQQYHLNQTGVGTIVTHTNGPRNHTVTGKIQVILFFFLFILLFAHFFLPVSLRSFFLSSLSHISTSSLPLFLPGHFSL